MIACGLKTGIVLVTLGSAIIIIFAVLGSVVNIKLDEGVHNIWKYEYDEDSISIDYDDCTNKTTIYYIYNITNSEEVKSGTEQPNLKMMVNNFVLKLINSLIGAI